MGEADKARKYFFKELSDRERAIFEGGITLGAIRHQFAGIPIRKDEAVLKAVEEVIQRTMSLQPYKVQVDVHIDINSIESEGRDPYDYESLKGSHMDVRVSVKYGRALATLRMRYIPELNFNLMYVETVEELPL